MNRPILVGVLLGGTAITAAGGMAGYHHWAASGSYAEVTDVKPILKTIKTPRQACHDEQVTRQKPVQDEHRVAGTVVGALVGGVLGNQIGGGNGKKLATVAGAAAGGYAGNQVQDRMQKGDTETTTEQRCETVYDLTEKTAAYEVTYRRDGKTATVRMDHNPGPRIPIRDGELVLEREAERAAS
jgi:uncharacterized protein YcfJ